MWDTRSQLGSATGNEIGATVSTSPFTSPSRSGAAPISGLVNVDDNHVLAAGGNDVALLDKRMNLQVVGKPMGGHKVSFRAGLSSPSLPFPPLLHPSTSNPHRRPPISIHPLPSRNP